MSGLGRWKRAADTFYRYPLLITLAISWILFLAGTTAVSLWNLSRGFAGGGGAQSFQLFLFSPLLTIFLSLPFVLTIENLIFLFLRPKTGREDVAMKKVEGLTVGLGAPLSYLFLGVADIRYADWEVQLYAASWESPLHTPIQTAALPTIVVIATVAVVGYAVVRFVPLRRQPPLVTVLGMAAMYLGIAECGVWCVQIFIQPGFVFLCLLPFNCIVIAARTIRSLAAQKKQLLAAEPDGRKCRGLAALLCRASAWPWLALLTAIPLLGVLVAVLALFGQEPDSVIRAWTQTADWTLSQKIPPQTIYTDGHYLCTVAAGGHRRVVKPLRSGKRHGHAVLVNRQLCVANAFEQLLEERTPRFHRAVRGFYDRAGYPIARHLHSPYAADAVYFLMKPLEWAFLLVLYLCDAKPENRIAVQYPHAPPPLRPGGKSGTGL